MTEPTEQEPIEAPLPTKPSAEFGRRLADGLYGDLPFTDQDKAVLEASGLI